MKVYLLEQRLQRGTCLLSPSESKNQEISTISWIMLKDTSNMKISSRSWRPNEHTQKGETPNEITRQNAPERRKDKPKRGSKRPTNQFNEYVFLESFREHILVECANGELK